MQDDTSVQKNKLFVGGLSDSIDNDALAQLFAPYGAITDAVVIMDRETGRSKCFGFVTFESDDSAQKALELDGTDVEGKSITVNLARPKVKRDNFRGGGGFRRDNKRF